MKKVLIASNNQGKVERFKNLAEKIDKELSGSISLEVVLDTGEENGLYDPNLLERLDAAASHVEKLEYRVEQIYRFTIAGMVEKQ